MQMEYNKKDVLIVEDDSSLLSCMQEGISNYDYVFFSCTCETAANGKDAIIKAKAHHYDLIITDMRMPEKDGVEFINEVRQTELHKTTPIIFISSYFDITPPEKYKKISDNITLLGKPFSLRSIVNTISTLLHSDQHSKINQDI